MKSGRKPMFEERTVVVAVRVPESWIERMSGIKSAWIRDSIRLKFLWETSAVEKAEGVNCDS